MAIINCPHCGKPTSSAARACRVCAAPLGTGNPEENARLAARARREQARRLSMHAVIATLIGVSGGLWLMLGQAPRSGSTARTIAMLLLLGGLAWYVYVRVRLWLHKRR